MHNIGLLFSIGLLWLPGLLLTGCAATAQQDVQARREFGAWRAEREERLRSPTGYLALVGLYWLSEGTHTFGSSPDNDLVLPPSRAPAKAGYFRVKAGQVSVVSTPQARLTCNGEPVSELRLISDALQQEPTKVHLGQLTFWLIQRGPRMGIRISDPQSPILQHYAGTPCFLYAPHWRVQARFEPFPAPRTISVPTILGTPTRMESPGSLSFDLDGQTYTLLPTAVSDTAYFIIFADQTNGKTTYGGGRFLEVPIADSGQHTIIDFNRAVNPPCAYSPFTTCPMPPRENELPLKIDAGERVVGLPAAGQE